MVIEHKSKLAAKKTVILAKEPLERLINTELVTTVATTTTTVSKGTTSVAEAEAAVGRATMIAEGTMKPAQGALTTTIFGKSFQRTEVNLTKLVKAANDLLSKDDMYTYLKDYGQFGG